MNNDQFLTTYDRGTLQQLETPRLNIENESIGQTIAVEVLRALDARGLTPQMYNDLSDADWEDLIRIVVATIPGAEKLSWHDQYSAANLGGNFFEHGYETILVNTSETDKVVLQDVLILEPVVIEPISDV